MKKGIHPKYGKITAVCSCGNSMQIQSTLQNNLNLDVCNKCHPFCTGKQKHDNKGGRADLFKKKFNIFKKNM